MGVDTTREPGERAKICVQEIRARYDEVMRTWCPFLQCVSRGTEQRTSDAALAGSGMFSASRGFPLTEPEVGRAFRCCFEFGTLLLLGPGGGDTVLIVARGARAFGGPFEISVAFGDETLVVVTQVEEFSRVALLAASRVSSAGSYYQGCEVYTQHSRRHSV